MTGARLHAGLTVVAFVAIAAGSMPQTRVDAAGPGAGPNEQTSPCGLGQMVPLLNSAPYQWKAGKQVGVWVDRDGSAAGDGHDNASPKFLLNDRDDAAVFAGINQWGDIPGTGVTFTRLPSADPAGASYWFTLAWPRATVTFQSSDGLDRRVTCSVPPSSLRAAAYTCSFEDVIGGTSQSHTIAAVVTMMNTHHTYLNPTDGDSYPTWVRNAPGWVPALRKIAAHENGHAMGLADLPARHPDGGERPHVMKPLNGSNDTAPHGGEPRLAAVTPCDRAVILDHPSRQYFRRVCAGPGAVAPPAACPAGEAPLCEGRVDVFPAPTWTCPSASSHPVETAVFVPTGGGRGSGPR